MHVTGNGSGCVRWHTDAPVWTAGGRPWSCMWSQGVWTETRRSERTRPDPVGTSFGLSEQPSARGWVAPVEGWEDEKEERIKSPGLRKRAIKPGTSWCSEKLCENSSVSTQRRRSNGSLFAGAGRWPLTPEFGKLWQLPLTWVHSTEGRARAGGSWAKNECKLSRIV